MSTRPRSAGPAAASTGSTPTASSTPARPSPKPSSSSAPQTPTPPHGAAPPGSLPREVRPREGVADRGPGRAWDDPGRDGQGRPGGRKGVPVAGQEARLPDGGASARRRARPLAGGADP